MRLTAITPLAVVLLFATPLVPAGESDIRQPRRGLFRMRPALAGKHPRLYFTAADVLQLRQLARGPNQWWIDRAKQSFAGRFQQTPSKKAGWKRYIYGFWGLTAADCLYVVEEDRAALNAARQWSRWLVDDRWWIKDDLIHMDCLTGLAITYDILYHELAPDQRAAYRAAIYEGMDFIHKRFFVGQYWTRDFQNNHMHNRLCALANAAFAIYGDDPEHDAQAHADLALHCVRQLVAWLPEDGSNHEGPGYWSYGHHWLTRVIHVASHVTGEDFAAQNPHFRNAHWFRIYMTAPGWEESFGIGDGAGTGNLTCLARSIAEGQDAHGQAWLHEAMQQRDGEFFQHPHWGLLWHDPEVEPRPYDEMPLWRFWPDLEMFSIRSSWTDDATAMVFKCGPVGGHTMQKLRFAAHRKSHYVNVAHDHPDQNHFLLYAHGEMLAEDDGYPKKTKLTRNHNTLTVDGKGQPREGTGWQQPFAYEKTGRLRDVFLAGATAFATGDAGPCYEGADAHLRHIAFVDGAYVIVLDDLEGAGREAHDYEWRLHKKGRWSSAGEGGFLVTGDRAALDIRFLLPDGEIASEFLPAERTAPPCLAVRQCAPNARFLALLQPTSGNQADREPALLEQGGCVTLQVTGTDAEDCFAVSTTDRPGRLTGGPLAGTGRSVLVRRDPKGRVDLIHLTRGRRLSVDRKTYVDASAPVDVHWTRTTGSAVRIEAAMPYKQEPDTVTLRVGGLRKNRRYAVTIDGKAGPGAKADAAGVVRLRLELAPRAVVELR